MLKQFIVIQQPKSKFRMSHATTFVLVTALTEKNAISTAIELGLKGEEKYFIKPCALPANEGKLYHV